MKNFRILFILFLIGLLPVRQAVADINGKISGSVKDKSNYTALPGANVIIAGTNRGAATNAEGYYYILAVPPGVYDITVSMIGYTTIRKTKVIVNAGHTTTLNFELQPTVIEAEEVVVIAERPMVELDRTMSKHTVTSEEIQQLPMVRSVSELTSLQAGVQPDGNIRGGDHGGGIGNSMDVVYFIDGIPLQNNNYLGSHYFKDVNTSALQEITVLTGGFDAEYGNAQGGIVNIVSKEGSQKFHGYLEYLFTPPGKKHWGLNRWDPYLNPKLDFDNPEWANERDAQGNLVHQKDDYTETAGHFVEASLSGPIASKATFFISGRYSKPNKWMPAPPTLPNYQGNSKLVYHLNPDIKLMAGGFWRRNEFYSGYVRGWSYDGYYLFYPDEKSELAKKWSQDDLEYLQYTHLLSSSAFFEIKFSRLATGEAYFNDRTGGSGEIIKDKENEFYIFNDELIDRKLDIVNYQLKCDLEWQINPTHQIKLGMLGTQWDASAYKYSESKGERYLEYYATIAQPDTSKPFDIAKPVTPYMLAAYFRDKIEFEGIVLNAGLRYEYFNPNTDRLKDPFDPIRRKYATLRKLRTAPTEPADAINVWSPRLGIAHPITENSVFHFNYGQYFQQPSFDRLYYAYWEQGHADDPGRQYSGMNYLEKTNNLRLEPETTTMYEIGFQYSFSNDYLLNVTAYYKSAKNQLSWGGFTTYAFFGSAPLFPIEDDPSPDQENMYRAWENAVYENARGLDFTLKKQFNDYFGFQIAYSLAYARKGVAGLRDVYLIPSKLLEPEYEPNLKAFLSAYAINRNQIVPNPWGTGWVLMNYEAGEINPKGGADLRNDGKLNVYGKFPEDFGFTVAGVHPLEKIYFNLLFKFRSGENFEYSPEPMVTQWRMKPLLTIADLSFGKRVNISRFELEIFSDIHNLFNTKNFNVICDERDFVKYGLVYHGSKELNLTPESERDFTARYDASRYQYAPRSFQVGARLSF
ncbi:TonB-dependent receptor [candidate division KSB1 bacterium]|nr:TonB-dependent receptor [candidate division KSB1 bacterium]